MVIINNNKSTSEIMQQQSTTESVETGRITKAKNHRNLENEEIHMYLSKLKELVPFMPKNRKLSKLEVIQYVIDYICDLQSALDSHPAISAAAITAAVASTSSRQPLGVIPPNTLTATVIAEASQQQSSTQTSSVLATDKVVVPDSRTVSC